MRVFSVFSPIMLILLQAMLAYCPTTAEGRDMYTAQKYYPEEFYEYFQPSQVLPYLVTNADEFIAFFSLMYCHLRDSQDVARREKSSSLKANHLSSYFFVPPFFSCQPENSRTLFQTCVILSRWSTLLTFREGNRPGSFPFSWPPRMTHLAGASSIHAVISALQTPLSCAHSWCAK